MSAAKIAFLAALAAVAHAADDDTIGFGPAFSLGPTQSWIREANTTIVLPEAPSPQVDRLALWPGMGTSGGDLIQALAVSFTDPSANCDGATAGQWCIWASTLQGTQLGGKMVPASAGDQVTMHCRFCSRRKLAGGPLKSGILANFVRQTSSTTTRASTTRPCSSTASRSLPCRPAPARPKAGGRQSSARPKPVPALLLPTVRDVPDVFAYSKFES